MYTATLLVPLIIGSALGLSSGDIAYLVAADLFACGFCTMLQIWRNRFSGLGLPVVLAGTFVVVAPALAIGSEHGINGIFGATIVAGLLAVLIASKFSKIVHFFPPVVTGTIVIIIGATLIPVAMNNLAGGLGHPEFGRLENVCLGIGVFAFIVIGNRFLAGYLKSISVLLGIILGTVIAYYLGMVDFTPVKNANWVNIPMPLHFGIPTFHLGAILTMIVVVIVGLIEATGVYYAMGETCGYNIKRKDLTRAYRSEGMAAFFGAIFNAFPHTTLSQNVGLAQISKVKSTDIIKISIVIFLVLGTLPKFAALATVIPAPVLGGSMLIMFGMIMAAGIRMLGKVDLNDSKNLLILAGSVSAAIGVTALPEILNHAPKMFQMFFESGIVTGSITAIALNMVFYDRKN